MKANTIAIQQPAFHLKLLVFGSLGILANCNRDSEAKSDSVAVKVDSANYLEEQDASSTAPAAAAEIDLVSYPLTEELIISRMGEPDDRYQSTHSNDYKITYFFDDPADFDGRYTVSGLTFTLREELLRNVEVIYRDHIPDPPPSGK